MNISKSSKLPLVALSILITMLIPANTFAGTLYVYERTSDQLGTIDPTTGIVTFIGELETPEGFINDLEFVDDRLFAIEAAHPTKGWILEIDPDTAEIISRSQLIRNGSPLTNAIEGLACDGQGGLVIAFWGNGSFSSNSNLVGSVTPDGIVAVSPVFSPWTDMDSLTHNVNGGYWLTDREPGPQTTEIRRIDSLTNPSIDINQWSFSTTVNGLQEITDDGAHLYSPDWITDLLHIIDRSTGQITNSIPTDPDLVLNGIAYRDNCLADLTGDGSVNFFDVSAFLLAFSAQDPIADFTHDGSYNFFDVSAFLLAYSAGCP